MGRPPTPRTTRACELDGCEETFEITAGKAQQARRYCSKNCSNKATAVARGLAYKAAYGYVPPTCPCGKTVEPGGRIRYAYAKKYCSPECRETYSKKRQPDPAKNRTRNCLTCGEEFTRYVSYGNGDTKYCSNACARKHTKTRKFYAVEGFDIVLESGFEVFFWGACQIAKIPIERFDRQYGVQWNDNPNSWYAPDFWLPRYEVAVEIKGLEGVEDSPKWAAFRATGRRLLVLDRDLLAVFSPDKLDIEIQEMFAWI
jgi:hypothetical protein